MKVKEEVFTKNPKETNGRDRCVHYNDHDGGSMGENTCEDLLSCTF